MSNSRLEKFIYAICGMEVDDLPTPLSRIETLWNCLITGEMPDFEPLSRNEKYLMAMLSGDIDGLPEPTSRSEKLLYKIATGETDLSDVPGYLSRYEELLKQLIENGGIGGTDFEYVLYTLNQPLSTLYTTAEGPVKSAILKGQTLVNLSTVKTSDFSGGRFIRIPLSQTLANGKKYIVKFDEKNSTLPNGFSVRFRVNTNGDTTGLISLNTPYTVTIDGLNYLEFFTKNADDTTNGYNATLDNITILEYQEGMENWGIPYFEGIQSVKMPVLTTIGKNLLSKESLRGYHQDVKEIDGWLIADSGDYGGNIVSKALIEKGKTYTLSTRIKTFDGGVAHYCFSHYGENDFNYLNGNNPFNGVVKFTATETTYIDVWLIRNGTNGSVHYTDIQLEEGSVATSYEPYKSNILSCNEEVTLRGIGEAKDTLDGNTGELTQRIGEIVLDGSVTPLTINTSKNNTIEVNFGRQTDMKIASRLMCDKLPNAEPYNTDIEGICCHVLNGNFHFNILKSKIENHTKQGVVDYLSQNPITVQYELETPTIKTVDLSITDQDGQPTKLSTFNDVTHVSIEAEDLLPTVDLEVPTKIEETLSSLPTQMIDISETQQLLSESIDDQSENINEVSTAITEIRSDIL